MDTSKLKVGDKIKNYKKMCELLGEETRGGDSKKAQLKDWERYFEYEKDKNSFIITDIYKTPLTKDTLNSKAVYAKNISNMLLLMVEEAGEDIIITKKQLMLRLGMINEKYCRQDLGDDFKKDMGSEKSKTFNVAQFFNNSYRKLNNVLNSSFKSLDNRGILQIDTDCYMLKYDEQKYAPYHLADQLEKDNIKTGIYYALKECKFESETEAFLSNKYNAYQEKLAETLDKQFGIKGIFKVVHIHPYNINTVREEINYQQEKNELNTKILAKIKEENQRIYDRQYALKFESDFGVQVKMFMYDIDFVEKQDALADYFIDLGY